MQNDKIQLFVKISNNLIPVSKTTHYNNRTRIHFLIETTEVKRLNLGEKLQEAIPIEIGVTQIDTNGELREVPLTEAHIILLTYIDEKQTQIVLELLTLKLNTYE